MITADPGVTYKAAEGASPSTYVRYIHVSPAELIVLLFLACVIGFIGRGLEP